MTDLDAIGHYSAYPLSFGWNAFKLTSDVCPQTSEPSSPDELRPAQQRFIVETITMTTVTERRIVREAGDTAEHANVNSPASAGPGAPPPHVGILKGGKLWRSSTEGAPAGNANAAAPPPAPPATSNGQAVNNNNEGETLVRFTDDDLAPAPGGKDAQGPDDVGNASTAAAAQDAHDAQPAPPTQPPPGQLPSLVPQLYQPRGESPNYRFSDCYT